MVLSEVSLAERPLHDQAPGNLVDHLTGGFHQVQGRRTSRIIGLAPPDARVEADPVPRAALSAKVRGTDDVSVAVFADGATNIGTFHEGINLAAIWNLLPTSFAGSASIATSN